MDALLPLPPEYDDGFLIRFEQVHTHPQSGPFNISAMPIYADILQSAPFRDCDTGHIWGETLFRPKEQFPCQNRPRLIATCMLALIEAQASERARQTTPQALQQRTFEAMSHIQTMCAHFLALRNKRALSGVAQAAQTAYVHTDTLEAALKIGSLVICVIL